MKKKYLLMVSLIIFLVPLLLHAQDFKAYTQVVPGEKITLDLVAIPGGAFTMGSNVKERSDEEKPAHKVVLADFWMGKYEVNWNQYEAFVYGEIESQVFEKSVLKKLGLDAVSGATQPYVDMSFNMGKGSSPAVNMTQYAALAFCKWLSAKTGVFYRLPTEAEWEYVCKTGTDSAQQLEDIAWYKSNSKDQYNKTGILQANTYGVHDILGNVSEWVMDQYDADFYRSSEKTNPWNKPKTLYPRVIRGGSWKDTADKVCCTSRQKSKSKWKQRDPQIPKSNWWHTNAPFVGFRIVRPKIQPTPEKIKAYWLEVTEDFGE